MAVGRVQRMKLNEISPQRIGRQKILNIHQIDSVASGI